MGQLVAHRLLGYRGVVVDVDPAFRENDAWCEAAVEASARSEPWYRILPDGTAHETYLPERSLAADANRERIRHPLVWFYFSDFCDGAYQSSKAVN